MATGTYIVSEPILIAQMQLQQEQYRATREQLSGWEVADPLEDSLIDDFHRAGIWLEHESKVCCWCRARFDINDPYVICPQCVDQSDPKPADERTYWLKTGREWSDPEPAHAPSGVGEPMT